MQCIRGYFKGSRLFQKEYCCNIFSVNYGKWKIVFFGSDKFSLVSLNELLKERHKNVVGNLEVVTTSANTVIYKYSVNNNLKVHLWPPQLNGTYDIGVIVSFGKLIPKKIIDLFPMGIINVHASLLPKWRGATPIIHSIKNGDVTTGISIQRINADAFDTGDIILKKECSIGENELLPSLCNRLSLMGSECLMEVLHNLPGLLHNSESQINEKASYARKFTKEIANVRWKDLTALETYNLYRALFGELELKTMWKGDQIKLTCVSISDSDENQESASPGSIRFSKEHQILLVKCKDRPIRVCSLITRGKLYHAKQFYKGFLGQVEKTEWIFGD